MCLSSVEETTGLSVAAHLIRLFICALCDSRSCMSVIFTSDRRATLLHVFLGRVVLAGIATWRGSWFRPIPASLCTLQLTNSVPTNVIPGNRYAGERFTSSSTGTLKVSSYPNSMSVQIIVHSAPFCSLHFSSKCALLLCHHICNLLCKDEHHIDIARKPSE